MSNTPDGGAAFPAQAYKEITHESAQGKAWLNHDHADGMTLRDWFAGQALAGILAQDSARQKARYEYAEKLGHGPTVMAALEAYQHADAMLKIRGLT